MTVQTQTHDLTASLGQALRKLYDVPLEAVHAAGIGERQAGPTTGAQAVAEWLGEPYDVAECHDPELVSEAVHAASTWLATPANLPDPRLEALGIADLNPANVLWDGTTCRLVDFEDGGLTDHVEHLAGRLTGVIDPDTLVRAVALSGEEQLRMGAYRPLWAAFWLVMLLPGNQGFRRNPPGTTEAQATHLLSLLD